MMTQTKHGLEWLVEALDAAGGVIDETTARRLLSRADIRPADVEPFVQVRAEAYNRCCIARREAYELLVLTWTPAQGSVAHDHSRSLCGLRVIQGELTERLYAEGPDGLVRKTDSTRLMAGEITVDAGKLIHSLANDSEEVLVTIHLYSPPLPEIRRYAITDEPPQALFVRERHPNSRVVAIVGGGFTGTMTLANLLQSAGESKSPLHLVLLDLQPAFGEGVAYRTNDGRHLLNVPAGRMSAWPDRPDDFLAFAQAMNPSVQAGDFLPRRIYGQYIRRTLRRIAESAGGEVSVEIVRDEATKLAAGPNSTWAIETKSGRVVRADIAVLAVGHRPPDDPFARRWSGPRSRFVANPWAALLLSQIGPDEPVLLLGSGLTAIDAILTLDRPNRTAPLIVVSRRGLMPLSHARERLPAADVSELLSQWLDPAAPLTVRRMVSTLRRRVTEAAKTGCDWRAVVDALRPAIAKLWDRLDPRERRRFLCHIRPFWEVHRHRMAPDIADSIESLRARGLLRLAAGALVSAVADEDGVDVTLSHRRNCTQRAVRVTWVINCTGPGIHNRHTTHPILRPLLESGSLCEDDLGLGLRTDSIGRAVNSDGETLSTLLVSGTLRKSTLWESTAIPELREQAQVIARTALAILGETCAVH